MNVGYCVCEGFCRCNLIGVDVSGSPRSINGQGWHHLGRLCANSLSITQNLGRVFKCHCRHSKVKTHYPNGSCNEHTMDVHMATRLIRSVISMLAGAPPGIFGNLSRTEASYKVILSKEEMQEARDIRNRLEDVGCDVKRFRMKCEARRSQQCPPPSKVSRGNRHKWGSEIINLTPVIGGTPVVGHAFGA